MQFLIYIKNCIFLYMFKHILKILVGKLIEFIERKQYNGYIFDENNSLYKIVEEKEFNKNIQTDTGRANANFIYKTQPYTVYEIILENSEKLECADKHIVYKYWDGYLLETYVKDLKVGDYVGTKQGPLKIIKVYKYPFKLMMYDLSIENKNHRYYTNDILSHNTTTTIAFLVWYLIFHIDRNCAILANKMATTTEIVNKVKDVFIGLPFFLKPGVININETKLKLDNGCFLFSQATTASAAIGTTVHCLYVDEAAYVPENIMQAFWKSVYPTLSSSLISQCIVSSTPNGMNNKFFELWDKAQKQENSFVPVRVDWWEVPGHDEEWAKQMRRDFGEEEFDQEFGLQFNVNSKLLLGSSELSFMKRIEKKYQWRELDNTDMDNEEYKNLKWRPDFDPNEKLKPYEKIVLSVDLGEGKYEDEDKEPDYNVISIFKIEPKSLSQIRKLKQSEYYLKNMFRFRQIGMYRDNEADEIQTAKICKELVFNIFNEDQCLVNLEVNFNGRNFITHFSQHPNFYEDIFLHTYHTKPIPGEKLPPKKIGYKTRSDKELYCKIGKNLLKNKTIIIDDSISIFEFSAFGRDKKGKLKGIGCKDDSCMANLNLSRVWNEEIWEDYLYDIFMEYPQDEKIKYMNNLLELREDIENGDMDDDTFNDFYDL